MKKKRRKLNAGKRLLSAAVAMTMAAEMLPGMAMAVNAAVSEKAVKAFSKIYDGDEARAREQLEALYQAGIIDENGDMVQLDIREDGSPVALEDMTNKIATGGAVGELTVNGRAVTQEQLMKIGETKNMLEIVKMMGEEVEITDEHVSNLENLIEGLADGSIDVDAALESGTFSMRAANTKAAPAALTSGLPSTATGSGEVEADANGVFTAPYISGSNYEASHGFQLSDPANKTYYTESGAAASQDDPVSSGIVTMSCNDSASMSTTRAMTFTVTARLNEAQTAEVSFDYSAVSGSFEIPETNGTVTFAPGETSQTFTVTIPVLGSDPWYGSRSFYIFAGNIHNGTFSDGATVWSKRIKASTTSNAYRDTVQGYLNYQKLGEISAATGALTATYTSSTKTYNYFYQKVNWMQDTRKVRYTVTLSGDYGDSNWGEFLLANNQFDPTAKAPKYNFYPWQTTDKTIVQRTGMGTRADSASGTTAIYTASYTEEFMAPIVSAGEAWIAYGTCNPMPTKIVVDGLVIPDVTISQIYVPAGSYRAGQTIPVTVVFSDYVQVSADSRLTVNGTECAPVDSDGLQSKRICFGYTVKETDSGSLNVTGLTGMSYFDFQALTFSSFPDLSADGVTIVSDVKRSSVDIDNATYGISDQIGSQVVTVLLPFKSGTSKTWLTSEAQSIGRTIQMPVPGYADATASSYLKGAYLSADGGQTRYPIYVIDNGGTEGVALAARLAPAANNTAYLRQENYQLYFDTDIVSDVSKYLDTWANAQTDAQGYAYFDGSAKTESAESWSGAVYTVYVLGGVLFDQNEHISRGTADYASRTENGYLALDDGYYVYLNDPDHPEDRYDVEILANEALYNGLTSGVRVEQAGDMILSYQFSDRKNFTFTDPQYFTWSSSNPDVASVDTNEDGTAHVVLTGQPGEVTFTLKVGNGSENKAYELTVPTLSVLEGKEPFFKIPEFSQLRTTLTDTDTDVAFTTNLTARNAQVGSDTVFTATLYRAHLADGTTDRYVKTSGALWTGDFNSTLEDVVTHITVPGGQISEAGTYLVEITTRYAGGEVQGAMTEAKDFTAEAYLNVKQAPAIVRLNTLDSYYVTADSIPAIGYTVTPAAAQVEYTIQKSGEPVSDRIPVSGGTISFAPQTPRSLKEAYTITVYARNSAEDEWSVDSMLLTVYNPQILNQIVTDVAAGRIGGTTGGTGESVSGTTVEMDNSGKMQGYGVTDGNAQLSFDDLTTLRTDMSLQKIVSMNYGEAVYGMLSDKMEWSSSDSSTVSVNYEQGGFYSDIHNYNYTSYMPATDFLLVGQADTAEGESVTITATHANTGIETSFDVTTKTLKDQLYVFQFSPAIETNVTYTNGRGEKRVLTTNEKGELAVYEPDGIAGSVSATSVDDSGKTYVGTLFPSDLRTGERDVSALKLYPCNNLKLREISSTTLTVLAPDGQPYNGEIILRGGVYKNGTYCPDATIRVGNSTEGINGRTDIRATVTDGKIDLRFDTSEFRIDPDDADELGGAQPGDTLTYVFEYRFDNSYVPGYVMLNTFTDLQGVSSPTDSLIQLHDSTGGNNSPQIIRQMMQQYYDGEPVAYSRSVLDFTDNIGISTRFNKAVVTTDVALSGETVTTDENGYAVYAPDGGVPKLSFTTSNNQVLTGQVNDERPEADQIVQIDDLDGSTMFVFPFSAVPMTRSYYTMTDENMSQDGISDVGENAVYFTRVKANFVRDGVTIKSQTLPYGVMNLTHQIDLTAENGGAKDMGKEIAEELKSRVDMGSIFNGINVDDTLRKGFVFLSGLSGKGGNSFINMMILPTQDPSTFRIVAMIGQNKRDKKKENPSVNFDPDQLYEDAEEFNEGVEDLMKQLEDSAEDAGDDGDMGDVKVKFNFYGAVVMEAKIGGLNGGWGFNFCGGHVGANLDVGYEWTQNFLVGGAVPVTVTLGIKGKADLEVAFANKADARAMLLDATVGITLEAFAGLGFDLSLVVCKMGVFGNIGAEYNILYLTKGDQVGHKLDITGEIGLQFKAKMLFVSYTHTFCSTSFGWTKKWGKYDQIRDTWEREGYAELSGTTTKGKPYKMSLLPNGTAMIEIDNQDGIENRDYLDAVPRVWSAPKRLPASSVGMATLQTNAYPYSNPVLTDDGSIMLYISDNGTKDVPEKVVSYALKSGNGYTEIGPVDTNPDAIPADTDVVASGTGSYAFAAWVKQHETLEKEMNDETTFDDLGMMMNSTEVYGGSYVNGQWTVQRLTDNSVADMAPTVASSGDKAIVAWRSLSASEMPEDGTEQDITSMFNVENTINYRIFNGTDWTDAQIAYNGSSGTINSIDSAMLPDGTALLVYSVRTTDDVTSSETFYTLIDAAGQVVTTGRLTNDSYTDTNAQVTAVDEQFVVGWYSEHEAGETTTSTEDGKPVVSYDIGLARINKNGSVDANFPESIGGTSSSKIGSDFHFSAPAGNTDLNKLSIVWSQPKESDEEADSNKQQLNAVRFYQDGDVIGVTAPTTIAETDNNYTIDHFDTYTDSKNQIQTVLIGSDYNTSSSDEVDTIESGNQGISFVNDDGDASDVLTILQRNPIASIKLASGAFPSTAIEADADLNLSDLMPGLTLPVQFTVKNTGASAISRVNVKIGSQTQEIAGLHILPGESAVLTSDYLVPETKVEDVNYTLTADGTAKATGTLTLNRPDIGISSMTVTREQDKERDIQLILRNESDIPLEGSGKTVKVAFYKDINHLNQVGTDITVDPSDYPDIDAGLYVLSQTLNVEEFLNGEEEIPDEGIRVFATAWVEDTEEPYTMNNDANVTFKGLLTKYDSQITMDSALIADGEGGYTLEADVSNNSLQDAAVGNIVADVLDSDHKLLKSVPVSGAALTLGGEQTRSFSVTLPEMDGEPASVSLRSSSSSVILDTALGGGTCAAGSITLTKDNTPSGILPEAEKENYSFDGWFTKPTGGDLVTSETVLEGGSTIYAQFTRVQFEQTFTIALDDYTYDGTAHTPRLTGMAYGKVKITYYDADTGEQLRKAPSEPGHYEVIVHAAGTESYLEAERSIEYRINAPSVESSVTLTAQTPSPVLSNGMTRVISGFSAEVEDGTEITEYGLLYSNNGTITDASALTLEAVDKVNVKQGKSLYEASILDNGKGVVAVGYVTLKDAWGNTATVYTEDIGGNYDQLMLAQSVTFTSNAPKAVLSSGKTRVISGFSADVQDGYTITAYGLLYSNNGTVTDASALTLEAVDKNNVKQGESLYEASLLDKGTGVVAVGYVTVQDAKGNTMTLYTEDLGGNYVQLAIAQAVTLTANAPEAVLSSGKTRVISGFSADVEDGYTITAYGLLYSNNGTITDASALTLEAIDKVNVKQGESLYEASLLDKGTGVVAVGYVTVKDADGNSTTLYTDELGGSYETLKK